MSLDTDYNETKYNGPQRAAITLSVSGCLERPTFLKGIKMAFEKVIPTIEDRIEEIKTLKIGESMSGKFLNKLPVTYVKFWGNGQELLSHIDSIKGKIIPEILEIEEMRFMFEGIVNDYAVFTFILDSKFPSSKHHYIFKLN